MISENLFLIPPYGRIPIEVNNNFHIKETSRSINRMVHSNTFLGDLFVAYRESNDEKYVAYAEKTMEKWLDFKENNLNSSLIFHDETTAQRLLYWLNFYYICSENFSSKFKYRLLNEIENTVSLLAKEDFHSTNTNHGMFQDIALLAYSILKYNTPKKSDEYKLAIRRLKEYFETSYTTEGIHKEHSPDYHFMVSSNVKKIANAIQLLDGKNSDDEEKLTLIFKKSEKYAIHILQPNLYLPKIGDCSGFELNDKLNYAELYNSKEFNFVKSKGKQGKEPPEKNVLFQNSGYFISRSSWDTKASYLLFLASYHAEYHKHSDDLSFILYRDGEIFIDSGPNGYNYDSKYTKYAYSNFAHSNLVVNDKPLFRHDGNYKAVGIESATFDDEEQEFKVKGYNKRYSSTKHYREISGNHKIGDYIIKDSIISEERNKYTLFFQLSHTIETIVNNNIISLYKENNKIAEIEFEFEGISGPPEIKVHKGETYPTYQGFEFLKMENEIPSPTIVLDFFNEHVETYIKSCIRFNNFKIQTKLLENEKSFGNNQIKYTFYKPEDLSTKKLLVIFSAIMPKYQYKYNYYHTLKNIDAYQLFLKDDIGEFGNYYIAKNKDMSFQNDVLSLILNTLKKYNIPFENVTLIGSSKGGYAALYYGIKYGFKNVIAGAPQTKLGNFVIDEAPHSDVAKVISGSSQEGDKIYLNNLLYSLDCEITDFSNYFICIGDKDHHYNGHIKPFLAHIRNYGNELAVSEIRNSDHDDLKIYFKDYIFESLNQIYSTNYSYNSNYKEVFLTSVLKSHTSKLINNQICSIHLEITGKNYNLVYYILDRENKVIYKSKPQKDNILEFKKEEILGKRIKIFIRNATDKNSYITPIIRELKNIEFNKSN